jgi:oleandomycin transport system permease protein
MSGTPHGNSTWISLAWAAGAILVLAPLAISKYRKAA